MVVFVSVFVGMEVLDESIQVFLDLGLSRNLLVAILDEYRVCGRMLPRGRFAIAIAVVVRIVIGSFQPGLFQDTPQNVIFRFGIAIPIVDIAF